MTVSLTSPVTGGAQTGLTSPTYTLVADTAPVVNGKQYAVSALGGTQTGVDIHTVSKPFTISVFKPAQFRTLGTVNPNTGALPDVPRNNYSILVRKGAAPLAGQANQIVVLKCTFEVPAGVDSTEPEELRAALSLLIGALNQASAGIGDTLVSGVLG